MIELTTPRGLPVRVPETLAEDPSPRFAVSERDEIRAYYREHGYVIVKSLFTVAQCDDARGLWAEEIKPFGGFMYRQATARAERHVINANGWVMNPILNLQSLDPHHFPRFREFASAQILAAPALRDVFSTLLDASPKIVQSMYFEGNSATWEHQDSYYLDSEHVGSMAAAWIALEDIAPRAGRFFICPGSHRIKLDAHGVSNNVADHHEDYIASVVKEIRALDLPIRAPVLHKGDVLLWNAWTIHGSLDSQDASHSRSSITCHAIPASHRFLQWQTRVRIVPTDELAGTYLYRPKDLSRFKNRLILGLESRFPSLFYALKRSAVKIVLRLKA